MPAQAPTHLEAAEIGQVDVEKDELGLELVGERQRRDAVGCLDHPHALVLEGHAHQLHHMRFVVGDQDGQHAGGWSKRSATGGHPTERAVALGQGRRSAARRGQPARAAGQQ